MCFQTRVTSFCYEQRAPGPIPNKTEIRTIGNVASAVKQLVTYRSLSLDFTCCLVCIRISLDAFSSVSFFKTVLLLFFHYQIKSIFRFSFLLASLDIFYGHIKNPHTICIVVFIIFSRLRKL